jgi:hypothetical protein
MKRSSISNALSLGLGVFLFLLGLLLLVREQFVVDFFASLFSDAQSQVIAGVILQGLGAFFVLNGTIKLFTNELKTRTTENQAFIVGLMQRIDRVEKRTVDVADKIVSLENARAVQKSVSGLTNCRFCGAKINRGITFCPNCGKSQK